MDRKVASLMMMVMMVMSSGAEGSISCSEVVSAVTPCVPYITEGGSVAADCCGGIKNLYKEASTSADKQAVCKCLKSSVSLVPNYKPSLLEGLPAKCGLTIPYKISPSTDCNSVN